MPSQGETEHDIRQGFVVHPGCRTKPPAVPVPLTIPIAITTCAAIATIAAGSAGTTSTPASRIQAKHPLYACG